MAIVGGAEELIDNLDVEGIWTAANVYGELTKASLGAHIKDMFGEGLRSILERY